MLSGERVYVYKLVVDDGGAPCVQKGQLSLAICKPIIRKVARTGSWIFGFAADGLYQTHPGNRLIYVARVADRIDARQYYADGSGFSDRPDCIYRWADGKFLWKPGAAYHKNGQALEHDLGTPEICYDRGTILLSHYFRYFGQDGPSPALPELDRVVSLLNHLTQGHRVKVDAETYGELARLAKESFRRKSVDTSCIARGLAGCSQRCGAGFASDDETADEDEEC